MSARLTFQTSICPTPKPGARVEKNFARARAAEERKRSSGFAPRFQPLGDIARHSAPKSRAKKGGLGDGF
jgi:hypothetical protein